MGCCSRPSAIPIRWCSSSRRASTGRRKARSRTTARPCRSTSPSFCREGTDVTLIGWGAILKETLAAADELAADGISAEVIDLATLKPYDEETILASVAKTGRCVIVHEAARTGGFGAEIAALIAERGLTSLLAPIARVTGYDTVIPLAAARAALHALGRPHRRGCAPGLPVRLNCIGGSPCASSCCRISAKASRRPRSSPGTSPRAITWSPTSRWCRWRPTRPSSRCPRRRAAASPGCSAPRAIW